LQKKNNKLGENFVKISKNRWKNLIFPPVLSMAEKMQLWYKYKDDFLELGKEKAEFFFTAEKLKAYT
jgi:hypothetical protein